MWAVSSLVAVLAVGLAAAAAVRDECQPPGTCAAPAASHTKLLPVSSRMQWWDSGGYCGALSVQTAALTYGAWISQDVVRKVAPPGGGHGDSQHGYEILHTNIGKALDTLRLAYDAFAYDKVPKPQSNAYLRWLKAHLAQQHPVVWFVLCKGDGHDVYGLAHYDHIEPVFGILSNHSLDNVTVENARVYPEDVVVHSSNWDHNSYYRTMNTLVDDLDMNGNCTNAVPGGGHNEAYPCIYRDTDYGVAITGPVDPAGKVLRASLDVGRWNEPDVRSGAFPAHMKVKLTVYDLTVGKSYVIYRFDGYDTVPTDSNYENGKYTSKSEFVASSITHVYEDPAAVVSDKSTFYRCVPASA